MRPGTGKPAARLPQGMIAARVIQHHGFISHKIPMETRRHKYARPGSRWTVRGPRGGECGRRSEVGIAGHWGHRLSRGWAAPGAGTGEKGVPPPHSEQPAPREGAWRGSGGHCGASALSSQTCSRPRWPGENPWSEKTIQISGPAQAQEVPAGQRGGRPPGRGRLAQRCGGTVVATQGKGASALEAKS